MIIQYMEFQTIGSKSICRSSFWMQKSVAFFFTNPTPDSLKLLICHGGIIVVVLRPGLTDEVLLAVCYERCPSIEINKI